MKILRILIAGIICLPIVAVTVYIYHHILFVPYHEYEHLNLPPEEKDDNFSKQFNDVPFTFYYIDKDIEPPTVEIRSIYHDIMLRYNPERKPHIIEIPASVMYNDTTYKVLSVTDNYAVICDTLFIPASVEYFDYAKLLDKSKADVYIIVEDGNKYYKSVNGNLYCGGSLVYVYRNPKTK